MRWPGKLAPLLVPLVLLGLWQLAALLYATPLFPGPDRVAVAFAQNATKILSEIGITLARATAGFALALIAMVPLGIVLGRIRILGRLLEPAMDMIATIPPPAIVPLAMLFAGTGDWAKVLVIAYAAAIPLLMNTYEASKSIHPMLSRVAAAHRLTAFETMRLIDWPASLPMIATGARLAIATSLLVSVTSEMLLATNGIGVFLQRAQETFRIDQGVAAILAIAVTGLIINTLVAALERRWLVWHYRGEDAQQGGGR
jgi:NitT/TauT family transport system permease protein